MRPWRVDVPVEKETPEDQQGRRRIKQASVHALCTEIVGLGSESHPGLAMGHGGEPPPKKNVYKRS